MNLCIGQDLCRKDDLPTLPLTCLQPNVLAYLLVSPAFKGFVSKTPYLIEETAIAPHITGCGVLAIDKSLWSCPLERDFPSLGHIVVILNQVPSHAKVTDLQCHE